MTIVFYARLYGRFMEIHSNLKINKLHRTNQGYNFGKVEAILAIKAIPK